MKSFITIFFLVVTLVSFSSCDEDSDFDKVFIIGIDERDCACCGGFKIYFGEDPEPFAEPFKLAYELPESAGITFESDFPIAACISWEPVESLCDVIEITEIRLR